MVPGGIEVLLTSISVWPQWSSRGWMGANLCSRFKHPVERLTGVRAADPFLCLYSAITHRWDVSVQIKYKWEIVLFWNYWWELVCIFFYMSYFHWFCRSMEICSHHYIIAYFMTTYALHACSHLSPFSGVSSCISVSQTASHDRRAWNKDKVEAVVEMYITSHNRHVCTLVSQCSFNDVWSKLFFS